MSGKLLAVGAVGLLAAGLALLHATSEPEASASAQRVADVTPAPEPGRGPAEREPPPSPKPAPTRAAPARPAATTPAALPSLPAGPAAPEDEIQYRPDGVPIAVADRPVLKKAAAGVDHLVRKCVAEHGGSTISGQLITTYTVARKRGPDGQFVVAVEDTGYDDDERTIEDPALIECLHETAYAMQFPPSTSPVATWAKRRIVIRRGIMVQNRVFQHGYFK